MEASKLRRGLQEATCGTVRLHSLTRRHYCPEKTRRDKDGRVVREKRGKLGPKADVLKLYDGSDSDNDEYPPDPEDGADPLPALAESSDDEEDDEDDLAVASATNWATSTPRENASGRAAQFRRMTQLAGVTSGSPLLVGKGAGTVTHFEQGCLYSVNVCCLTGSRFGSTVTVCGDGVT
jgi:hypothetical protein